MPPRNRTGPLARWTRALRGRPRRPRPERPVVRLDQVRRRLEILLAAVYERPIPIVAAQPPRRPGWAARLFPGAPHLRVGAPLAASDAERVHLPPELDAAEGEAAALARYRLLAVGQAERLARGTALWTPDLNARWNRHLVAAGALSPSDDVPRIRDLYLLLENAAADEAVVRAVPGLAPALAAERARALAARPDPAALTPAERQMESLVRRILSLAPGQAPPELAPGATPAESLQRARRLAADLPRGRYRGIAAVAAWGTVARMGNPGAIRLDNPFTPQQGGGHGLGMEGVGTGSKGVAATTELDTRQRRPQGGSTPDAHGSAPLDAAAPPPGAEDERPADAEPPPDEDAGAGGPGGGGTASAPGGGVGGSPAGPVQAAPGDVTYPEWNREHERYEARGAVVRALPPHPGDEGWAMAVLAHYGALVRRLRERFERLRAQRTRLMAQRRGDELDVAACVRALVDLRAGRSPDERLYADVRPARRGVAITLLVDVSGSTDEFVGKSRIIDVEKVAVLLASEALDALGDLYSVATFSSLGAGEVRMRTIKDFGERNGRAVRQRIGALKPEGYTRMGAAIRHAAAGLARTRAGHRLLLILSDGKPNDRDHYQGSFAVEDTRQAIAEARAAGVHPFCLTVDRGASAYATRIFGPAGHQILRHPDQLPNALLQVVRRILVSR